MSLQKIRNLTFRHRVCNLVSIFAEPQNHLNHFFHVMTAPSRSGPPNFRITLRHTTLDRTSPGEWPARRTDLYLTTHNTHNRPVTTLSGGFIPTIPASDRQQKHALDRASIGFGSAKSFLLPWCNSPSGPRFPYYRGYMITLRYTTLGSTPLDEWSAWRRDF